MQFGACHKAHRAGRPFRQAGVPGKSRSMPLLARQQIVSRKTKMFVKATQRRVLSECERSFTVFIRSGCRMRHAVNGKKWTADVGEVTLNGK